jgi:PhnB protein
MMVQPIPYLGFNGNCAEAMKFYEKALNGKLEVLLKNSDSPMGAQMGPENGDRIMYARLSLKGNGMLFAGDCMPDMPYKGMHGVSLALMYDTVEEAQKVFQQLAEGGNITMPLGPTFWAKIFGMVIDRFGTPWMVNGENVPHDQWQS